MCIPLSGRLCRVKGWWCWKLGGIALGAEMSVLRFVLVWKGKGRYDLQERTASDIYFSLRVGR